MLWSGINRRACSGWLQKNQPTNFNSDLKLQKFLFLYESIEETLNNNGDFHKLKGYANGPVFSDVYGDCFHERSNFYNNVQEIYDEHSHLVNDKSAKLAGFLVQIMNEDELSLLTHNFNIWKSKETNILRGERNVSLSKTDFNDKDKSLISSFYNAYSDEYIESVTVLEINKKSFVISKSDFKKIIDQDIDIELFIQLSEQEDLLNPVYLSISEDGVILVD